MGATISPIEAAGIPVRAIARRGSEPTVAPVPLAFEEFYRREYRRVVALARSLTGDVALAEEIAQEGFIAAHRRWSRVAGYDRPGDWVRRVVVNRAISLHRRRGAEQRALARSGRPPSVAAPPPEGDEWLWTQVRSLPPRQAQAIALVYVEDLPLEQVAAILGCAETTVKTHLKRGRDTLAVRIRARAADGDEGTPATSERPEAVRRA